MKIKILSLFLCISMIASMLMGCSVKRISEENQVQTENNDRSIKDIADKIKSEKSESESEIDPEYESESESIDNTEEYKFKVFAYWISDASYSNHVLHLINTGATGNLKFDMTYDIDPNCKWTQIDVNGNVEDIGANGDEAAAQVIIDKIHYAYPLYKAWVEGKNDNFGSKDYIYRDKAIYTLIMKGYSTGKESATITDIQLVHNDQKEDNQMVYKY